MGQRTIPESVDLLIVNALCEEREWVQRVFTQEWQQVERQGTMYHLAEVEVKSGTITVATVSQLHMGMVFAAILTTKSLQLWRPRLLAMTGICAGIENRVQLGDLVVATQLFDYGSGKIEQGELQPHHYALNIEPWLWEIASSAGENEAVCSGILKEFSGDGLLPDTGLNVHFGPMASGSAVIADNNYLEPILRQERKLLAIDMEGYALGLAAMMACSRDYHLPFLVLKGVTDFASATKGDDYHEFAAYNSAAFLKKLLEEHSEALGLGT